MKDGVSAFPGFGSSVNPYTDQPSLECVDPGMTLRDWFAGQALMGCISGNYKMFTTIYAPALAKTSYVIADAMLAAREKTV
jgi:hypothetical protein